MNIPEIMVNLKCLFCSSPIEKSKDLKLISGDFFQCSKCGEYNDYTSLLDVAKEEAREIAKSSAKDLLKKEFKRLFKGN